MGCKVLSYSDPMRSKFAQVRKLVGERAFGRRKQKARGLRVAFSACSDETKRGAYIATLGAFQEHLPVGRRVVFQSYTVRNEQDLVRIDFGEVLRSDLLHLSVNRQPAWGHEFY